MCMQTVLGERITRDQEVKGKWMEGKDSDLAD